MVAKLTICCHLLTGCLFPPQIIPDTGTSMEDEVSDQSGGELPRLLACFPVPPLAPHAMGVTQLLEAVS